MMKAYEELKNPVAESFYFLVSGPVLATHRKVSVTCNTSMSCTWWTLRDSSASAFFV